MFKIDIEKYKNVVSNLVKLALPILAGNISQILIMFTDTIVAGRYSTVALGAISVASAITMTATIGAIGLIIAITPVIANYRGAKMPTRKYFSATIIYSLLVCIPFFIALKLIIFNIDFFKLSPELIIYVKEYLNICVWTIFPAAIFVGLKEFLQAYEKVIFANLLMFFMVICNLFLNIVLTFGWNTSLINIPAYGITGLAFATLFSRLIVCVFLLIYCIPLFEYGLVFSKKYIKELLKVGFPMSVAMFCEFLGFNLSAILIGKFSALFAAVHNIILCMANMTFMIVLSISSAASIKIGYFNGKKSKKNVILYSKMNILLATLIAFCAFLILIFFNNEIISLFSKDKEVLSLALKMLKFALCFLFFDCLQCACSGILKGLKDTKIVMFSTILGYVAIAIPLGSFLAFKKGIVLEGFWFGLSIALFIISLINSLRAVYDIKKLPYGKGRKSSISRVL